MPDQEVPPCPQALQAVQRGQHRFLAADDGLGLVLDDRLNQGLLVLEVVIDLRAAHPGGRPDILDGRPGDAAVEHQLGRRRDNPLPGLLALRRQPARHPPVFP